MRLTFKTIYSSSQFCTDMFCDYTAGWLSGVAALLIGHPLDTIKIQQQVRGFTFTQAFVKIKKHRGWKGFYRGLLVPLVTTGTINSIFFGVYGDVRSYLINTRKERQWSFESLLNSTFEWSHERHKYMSIADKSLSEGSIIDTKNPTFSELCIAGGIAGFVSIVFSTPAELVKTKLQSQMKRHIFKGPFDCFKRIADETGFRGLYRGLIPMAYRETVGGAAYFAAYETISQTSTDISFTKKICLQVLGGSAAVGSTINLIALCYFLKACGEIDDLDMLAFLKATGVAGVAAWTAILPFDTIKSRMQADDHLKPNYKNMLHCAKDVYRTGGLVGFYRGFWSCTARAIPVNAAIFVVYEFLQQKICRDNQ